MRLLRGRRDRGAAAVEFAIILPLLAALTLGILAFGHAFHVQTVLDNAAREGVRVAALTTGSTRIAAAQQAAIDSASPSIALTRSQVVVTPATCAGGANARVTITVPQLPLLGGIGTIRLSGTGTMRCQG
ncbi:MULTISPECIES: TadE family protein [unclassified Agrococcus]|uniref:TadE family protein n=1 Tax=unclassified Agrococcus TaxID=2615065 RepID=UPI00361493BC